MPDIETPNFAYGIANVIIPRGGPKTVPVTMDFTGTDGIFEIDGTVLVQNSKIEYLQTMYVDNNDNANDLTIEMSITNQRIVVPAGSQGYYSMLQPNPPKIIFTTVAGAFSIFVQFLNVPVQPAVWGGSAASGGLTDTQLRASPIEVQNQGGALTDRSIANLSGASEPLMAANANRHYLLIQNISANNMGINLNGGVAAIGTAGTITLAAGGSLEMNFPPIGAITIIGTLNDDVTAFEG